METFSRSLFSGIPIEFSIPSSAKVVFVNDFFVKDVEGGAELTSEAIIAKAPVRVFKLHSASLTKKLLDANKDKYWIFGNFTTLPDGMIYYIPRSGVRYSVVEYDFKFCAFRSTNRHKQLANQPCNCPDEPHGFDIGTFFNEAKSIFWMSEGQKQAWLEKMPSLASHEKHLVLSSVFKDSDLDFLKSLRESAPRRFLQWAVLGSGSWIKGVNETIEWCRINRRPFQPLPKLPYTKFLEELNKYQGFVFMPLDKDTCPRVTIEAKLLGLNLQLNDNVLSKNDPWFTGTPEDCETYLRGRATWFWEQLSLD